MLDTHLPWRHDGRCVACCLLSLAGVAFAAGCDDTNDVIQSAPRAGSGGGGAGGSGGGTAGNTAGGEGGGAGGTEPEDRDAGADAASPANDCVLGTLEQYCSRRDCPAFADARASLRRPGQFVTPQVIVQRPCTAPSGAARVSVSANYGSWSLTYVYDAATLALVGVEFIDDLGPCSGAGVEFEHPGFGLVSGDYGEASPDCGSGFSDFYVPAECGSLDAGAPEDAGPDAGPIECILTSP